MRTRTVTYKNVDKFTVRFTSELVGSDVEDSFDSLIRL
jgi:hypothetical protein